MTFVTDEKRFSLYFCNVKSLVSILLSTFILFMSLQNTFILVSFKINQDYIAEFLCVNKDKPELNCAGSCHLKESLDKANPIQENQSTPIFNETENLVLFNQDFSESEKDFYSINKPVFYSEEDLRYFEFVKNYFHPPENILV